jgi:hypothetical protein
LRRGLTIIRRCGLRRLAHGGSSSSRCSHRFIFRRWRFFSGDSSSSRADGLFDDAHGARRGCLFLGEILVAYLVGQLFGDRVRRHTDIYALAAHFFDETLRVEFQFFC